MKTKKMLSFALAAIIALSSLLLVACPDGGGEQKFTVGICQLAQHAALDAATQGFMDALVAELGEDNVTFDLQNASGDTNVCNTIISSFVARGVDLIMANATPALQAAYNATESIPILGTSVTEYGVALGVDGGFKDGIIGSNVSGTSDLAPLDEQAAMIAELCPTAKKVGIIYCTAESNSKYQVEQMTKHLSSLGITAVPFSFTDTNDISAIVTAAAESCDVLYVPTDNTAASCAETIGNIVREKKIPLFAGEENVAKVCGVASLSISYYDLGVVTGKMAAKILKGEADISTMPVEYAAPTKKFNKEMAELCGISIPEGYTEIEQ